MRRHRSLGRWREEGKPRVSSEGTPFLPTLRVFCHRPLGMFDQATPRGCLCQRCLLPDIVFGFPSGHPCASCILKSTLESGGTFQALCRFRCLSCPDPGMLAPCQPWSFSAPLANVTPVWPWYLPPLSAYVISGGSDTWRNWNWQIPRPGWSNTYLGD